MIETYSIPVDDVPSKGDVKKKSPHSNKSIGRRQSQVWCGCQKDIMLLP